MNDYLHDAKVPDAYPGQPVTLHHLLTYTSGFDDDIYGWSQWGYDEMPSLTKFAAVAQPPRVRPPDEPVAYNNYDFVLAGRLIEIASGQSYGEYLAEHIFAPAGMTDTTAVQPHPESLQAHVTPGYRPAGSDVITTRADLGRFMIAQLGADSRLGAEVAQTMQQEQFTVHSGVPGMGYAFEQRPMNGQRVATKDGDQPGTLHNLALLPEHDIGIHVAYNGDGTNGAAFGGGKELVRTILDENFPAPTSDVPARPAPVQSEVSEPAGTYRARTSQSIFAKVTSLTAPVTVAANSAGTLTTSGLSKNPAVSEQTWHQTSPGQFRLEDGQATLAVTDSGALPARALVGRARSRAAGPVGARVAQILAWTAGLCLLMFGAGFALVSSDPNRLVRLPLTGDPILSIALNTVSVMGAVTATMLVLSVLALVRGWWSIPGRIAYAVIALAAVALVAVCIVYRLVGVPFVVTV